MEGDEDDDDKFILMTGTRKRFGKGAWSDLDAERREGMGPTKIRIGRGENAVTYDYGRLDPASTALATTIDWIREIKLVSRKKKSIPDAAITLLSDTIVGQMTEKSMLRGINDVFKMMEGRLSPTKYAARQLATMLVPNMIRQPIRDSNEFYDTPIVEPGMKGALETLAYEMYPQNEDGAILPKNPIYVPPPKRNAYGDMVERPEGSVLKKTEITKIHSDEVIRRARRNDPHNKDIRMPSRLGKTYRYEDPVTGDKRDQKLTPKQYDILQTIYRNEWKLEEAKGLTTAEEVSKAKDRAASLARGIAMANESFIKEGRRTDRALRKKTEGLK
jgi:hypothetical protein